MKKKLIIALLILSNILVFFVSKYSFSEYSIEKLNGTYVFKKEDVLDVFQDTYLSLSEDTGEYFYISSSVQQKGNLIKKKNNIYLLQNDELDEAYIVITKDNNIIILKDNKIINIYKFDNQLTLIS